MLPVLRDKSVPWCKQVSALAFSLAGQRVLHRNPPSKWFVNRKMPQIKSLKRRVFKTRLELRLLPKSFNLNLPKLNIQIQKEKKKKNHKPGLRFRRMLIFLPKLPFHLFLSCHPLFSTAPGSCVLSNHSWYILAGLPELLHADINLSRPTSGQLTH